MNLTTSRVTIERLPVAEFEAVMARADAAIQSADALKAEHATRFPRAAPTLETELQALFTSAGYTIDEISAAVVDALTRGTGYYSYAIGEDEADAVNDLIVLHTSDREYESAADWPAWTDDEVWEDQDFHVTQDGRHSDLVKAMCLLGLGFDEALRRLSAGGPVSPPDPLAIYPVTRWVESEAWVEEYLAANDRRSAASEDPASWSSSDPLPASAVPSWAEPFSTYRPDPDDSAWAARLFAATAEDGARSPDALSLGLVVLGLQPICGGSPADEKPVKVSPARRRRGNDLTDYDHWVAHGCV